MVAPDALHGRHYNFGGWLLSCDGLFCGSLQPCFLLIRQINTRLVLSHPGHKDMARVGRSKIVGINLLNQSFCRSARPMPCRGGFSGKKRPPTEAGGLEFKMRFCAEGAIGRTRGASTCLPCRRRVRRPELRAWAPEARQSGLRWSAAGRQSRRHSAAPSGSPLSDQ